MTVLYSTLIFALSIRRGSKRSGGVEVSQAGSFLSIAASHWEMVVSRHEGRLYCTVRGPETHPTVAHCPPDGEWLGIQFKHGVFMPHLPVSELVDGDVELPDASGRSFWLHGSAWEFPTFDNADAFIARLVKEELLVCDPVVESALQAQPIDLSPRTVQRRFLRATGLTHGTVSQIERAHFAVALLRQGVSILDTTRAGRLCRSTPPDPFAQATDRPNSGATCRRYNAAVGFVCDRTG